MTTTTDTTLGVLLTDEDVAALQLLFDHARTCELLDPVPAPDRVRIVKALNRIENQIDHALFYGGVDA